MTHTENTVSALEGRLMAHRRLLAHLLSLLPQQQQASVADWLEDRIVPQDGQEDPGAVPTEGLGPALSIADEYRELAKLARQQTDQP
jgi:hypothetical protein